MTIMIMYAILTTAASMTWLMINPLTLALTILIMSMSVAMLFAFNVSSWIAFLVFLIYIGGMMVMFAYFVAMSPNMKMNMTWPIIFSMSTFFLLLMYMNQLCMKPDMLSFMSPSLNTFYSLEMNQSLIMLALLLLLTMIIVVKLASINKGPLRPFN